ncbi:MAG TPA: hypothetical protein VIY09_01155, partial [Rhizomicrobium sp.]
MPAAGAKIERLSAQAFTIPTDAPESDGTAQWDRTTMILVEAEAGGVHAIGYSYAAASAAGIVNDVLRSSVETHDCFAIESIWQEMVARVRNLGWRGVCANAIAAVDLALWDLKAKLLGLPLVDLLGRARDKVPA